MPENPYQPPSVAGDSPSPAPIFPTIAIATAWLLAGDVLGVAIVAGLIRLGAARPMDLLAFVVLFVCTASLGAFGARRVGLTVHAAIVYPFVVLAPTFILQPAISGTAEHRRNPWADWQGFLAVATMVAVLGLIGTVLRVVQRQRQFNAALPPE